MAAREAGKRRTRLTLPVPAEAVVDPRIGARGPALLALEDGTVFPGIAFGAPVAAGGDLVVNTSQTGYQEVCTDPSYAGQVVVMTYPLIGNHGRLEGDDQSERPWLRGLVVAMRPPACWVGRARSCTCCARTACRPSPDWTRARWRATCARPAAQRAIITAPGEIDPDAGGGRGPRGAALGGPGLRGGRVGPDPYEVPPSGPARADRATRGRRRLRPQDNIVRALAARGARVRVLPHTVDGRRRSSPPTWPASCSRPGRATRPGSDGPVALAEAIIADGRPLLGICLGHQIVAGGRRARRRVVCGSATTAPTIRSRTSTPAGCR